MACVARSRGKTIFTSKGESLSSLTSGLRATTRRNEHPGCPGRSPRLAPRSPLKQGAAGRLINVAKVQSPSRAVVPANRPPGRTRSCRRIQAAAIAPRAGAAHRVRPQRCSNGAAIGSKEPSGSSTIVNVGVDELGFPDFGPSMRWVCLDADDPQLLDGLAAPAPIPEITPASGAAARPQKDGFQGILKLLPDGPVPVKACALPARFRKRL